MNLPNGPANPAKKIPASGIKTSILFYIGCGVVVVATLLLTNFINGRPFTYPPVGAGSDVTGKALDAYAAVTNLLTTLDTGLIAGLGLLLTSKDRDPSRNIWPAALSALCVGESLYWGYICSQNAQWAIEAVAPTLDLTQLQLPRQLQFGAIVLGVCFFADFVRRDLTATD